MRFVLKKIGISFYYQVTQNVTNFVWKKCEMEIVQCTMWKYSTSIAFKSFGQYDYDLSI